MIQSRLAERLSRPWGGVKALERVRDSQSDPWPSPLSIKPSQGVVDVQDEVRGVGDASCAVRAYRFELFYSRFDPGFSPDSRSHFLSHDPSLH